MIIRNIGAIYKDNVLWVLNTDKAFTKECVMIQGTSDLLFKYFLHTKPTDYSMEEINIKEPSSFSAFRKAY